MQQATIDDHLINRIVHAFSRAESCCDYLFDGSDGMGSKFGLLSYEFGTAQSAVESLLREGTWTDESVRNDVLRMLREGASVMEMAGLPFLRREIAALIEDVGSSSH